MMCYIISNTKDFLIFFKSANNDRMKDSDWFLADESGACSGSSHSSTAQI